MATPFGQAFGSGQPPMQPMLPAMPPFGQPPVPAAPMGPAPALAPMDLSSYAAGLNAQPMPQQLLIDKLRPGSDLEKDTRQKLEAMFKFSQSEMASHHDRWRWQEQRIQAYIALPDYQLAMNQLKNNQGAPPEVLKVIVPYSYATLHAAATYIFTSLVGRRPVFPLMAIAGAAANNTRYMEQALQSNIEMSRGYEVLWQMIWDSLVYMFGAVRIGWEEQNGKMLKIIGGQRQMMDGLKYAGNKLFAQDPYHLFPDPRVPLHQANKKGDFMMWVSRQSMMLLKQMENDGHIRWVDKAIVAQRDGRYHEPEELPAFADSNRRARIGTSGGWLPTPNNVTAMPMIKEGTVRIIPKDWKFGDSDRPELWKFMWTSAQITQAQPLGMVHDMHPMAITEPTSLGHEFGSISFADFLGPFQDLLSWLVNSRMENVRTSVNNQFIADPARIEMQDIRSPAPGRVIRLKHSAMGLPVSEAIKQLVVQDVTMGHFNDIQLLRTLADSTTGVNDNLRGIQTQGGRRSATEARMSMQAGGTRLGQLAVRISQQSMMDIADQMISNIQQLMPDEMWVSLTGDDGQGQSSLLTPDKIVGGFNYQISDGSLPHDKQALLEVWKEILFGIAKDPELRQAKDLVKIFDYVAELGGAKNISAFNRQQQIMPGQQQPPGTAPVGPAMPPVPSPFSAGA